MSGEPIIYVGGDFEAALQALPGGDTADFMFFDDSSEGATWEEFQGLLAAVASSPLEYRDRGRWDCDKIARWMWAQLNLAWTQKYPDRLPLAGGVLAGDVPLDGDNAQEGWHMLLCFFDRFEKGTLWLAGAQDRKVMSAGRAAEIKAVEALIVGG